MGFLLEEKVELLKMADPKHGGKFQWPEFV